MEADEGTKADSLSPKPAYEAVVSETESNKQPRRHQTSQADEDEEAAGGADRIGDSKPTPIDQKEILRALEFVERDSLAIAQSFTSLFASLRLSLCEITSNSVDHIQCFNDAAGRLQECEEPEIIEVAMQQLYIALDAATKGNRYINSCLRLNEEMKGIDSLATQIKMLRRNVDTLDLAANRSLQLP